MAVKFTAAALAVTIAVSTWGASSRASTISADARPVPTVMTPTSQSLAQFLNTPGTQVITALEGPSGVNVSLMSQNKLVLCVLTPAPADRSEPPTSMCYILN